MFAGHVLAQARLDSMAHSPARTPPGVRLIRRKVVRAFQKGLLTKESELRRRKPATAYKPAVGNAAKQSTGHTGRNCRDGRQRRQTWCGVNRSVGTAAGVDRASYCCAPERAPIAAAKWSPSATMALP